MKRFSALLVTASVTLAACSQAPELPRLSEVEIDETQTEALASDTTEAPPEEGGFLSALLNKPDAVDADPVPDGETLQTTEVTSLEDASDSIAQVQDALGEPEPAVERPRGLLARFLNRDAPEEPAVAAATTAVAVATAPEGTADVEVAAVDPATPIVETATSSVETEEAVAAEVVLTTPEPDAFAEPAVTVLAEQPTPRRAGLLGFLRRSPSNDADQNTDSVQTAALTPETTTDAPAAGLFSNNRGGPRPGAADYEQVPVGTSLPYGRLARLCGVPDSQLGKVVSQYPETGRAKFKVHDTSPGATAPRTMFVTGFSDGCARQFTAALAIFGDFVIHEQLRYGLPSKTIPYSETDEAYEALKSKVCRVGKNKPCGDRIKRLTKDGTFLSLYERFEGSNSWKNILLHDKEVLAFDVKGR